MIARRLSFRSPVSVSFAPPLGRTNIYPDSMMQMPAKELLRRLGIYADHIFIHDILLLTC